MTSSHNVTTRCNQEFLGVILLNEKLKFNGDQEKRIHYFCEDEIEKSVPQDHCLSSLGKPCDDK